MGRHELCLDVGAGDCGETALPLVLVGAGMGMTWPVYMVATQNAVARTEFGVASGALLFFRTMAGSVGVAVVGGVLSARLGERTGPHALAGALQTVFLLLVPLAAGLLVVATVLDELPLPSASDEQNLPHVSRLDTVAE
jgi:MFS family permease